MATIAGSLRNKVLVLDDVTTGDLTVTGSVTITGTATTINSTNTSINDHLIELNAGLTGANANDTGLILERGSTGNNIFIGWDESADKVIVASTTADGTATGNLSLAAANFQAAGILGTSLDINGNADISGTLTMSNSSAGNMLNMNNNNIIGVNAIQMADPGPNEGVTWSNIKIYESPDDLTTNSAGNFQVVYGSTRRLTVSGSGIDANGTIKVSNSGTQRGELSIESTDNFKVTATTGGGAGLLLWGAGGTTPTISPLKEGSGVDGEVNLGRSSERFNDAYFSGILYTGNGTNAAPSHTFSGDTDTGMYRGSSNSLQFSTGGVMRLNLDSSGHSNFTGQTRTDDYFQVNSSGSLLKVNITAWNTHAVQDVIKNSYNSTIGDFLTVKASGNGANNHGAIVIADNIFAYGRTEKAAETAASTTAPFTTNAFQVTNTGNANFAGTVTATGGNSTNWNTAHGWGNHASAGYLTSSSTQSKYLRSDANDTATGTITFNNTPILAGTSGNEGGELNFGAPTGGVYSSFAVDNYQGHIRVHTLQSGKNFQIVGAGETARTTINTNIGTVWGSNNDGANSGLDADKLDGEHGSYYLAYGNFTGTPTIPDTSGLAPIDNPTFTGEVNIPSKLRHAGDTDTYFQFPAANQARVVAGNSEVVKWLNTEMRMNKPITINNSSSYDETTLAGIGHSEKNAIIHVPSRGVSQNTYMPWIQQSNTHGSGYRTSFVIGAYKQAFLSNGTTQAGWGYGQTGIFMAVGTNDSYPTQEFRFATGGKIWYTAGGDDTYLDLGTDSTIGFSTSGTERLSITDSGLSVAGSLGVTNIVTNKVVKFNGSILDDSNITDTGSLITLGSTTTVSGNISATQVLATSNGAGTNFKVGDDAWIGDINVANTIRISGAQNANNGYISFGNSSNTALGRAGSGQLTWGSDEIYHEGHKPTYSELGTMAYSNLTGTPTIPNISGLLPKAGGEMTGSLTIDVDNQSGGALRIEANQTNPNNDFYFAQEMYSTLSGSTATTSDREQGGIYLDLNSSATGGDTSNEHRVYGVYLDVDTTGDADLVYGVYSNVAATPTTGQTTNVYGGYFFAEDNGGAGAVQNVYGVMGVAQSDNAASDTDTMYGLYGRAVNTGDSQFVTTARGVYGEVEIAADGGDKFGTTYVFESQYDNNSGVAQTHTAALYYGNYAGTLPTTPFGVYIADEVPNKFNGTLQSGVGGVNRVSYGFNDDLNTGMYSPANHELGFTTNGVQRLKLTTSETVVNDGSNDYNFRVESNNNDAMIFVDGGTDKVSIGTSDAGSMDGRFTVQGAGISGTDGDIKVHACIAGSRHHLDIEEERTANTSDWQNTIYRLGMRVDNTDHQAIEFYSDGNSAEHIDIRTGNRVFNTRFTHDGKVGIGTSSPGTKLDVTGAIKGTEFDLPSGGMLDWANGDARIVEGLVNNYSLSFQTYDGSNVSTALRLDGNNDATFGGTGKFQGNYSTSNNTLNLLGDSNGSGVGITFSDNGTPAVSNSGQRGYLSYYHGDGASYGSGNAFIFNSSESTLSVVVKGKLMFDEGLYVDPTSGTGAGTQLMTSSGKLTNAALQEDLRPTPSGSSGGTYTGNTPLSSAGSAFIKYQNQNFTGVPGLIQFYISGSTQTNSETSTYLKHQFEHDGDAHHDGDVIAFSTTTGSDRKLKKNIRDLEGSLDKTLKLRGVKFDWKDENKANDQLGFIAQEVEEVLPEVVKEVKTLTEKDDTHLTVNYPAVVPLLVEAIKEQQSLINRLEERLNNLENKLGEK